MPIIVCTWESPWTGVWRNFTRRRKTVEEESWLTPYLNSQKATVSGNTESPMRNQGILHYGHVCSVSMMISCLTSCMNTETSLKYLEIPSIRLWMMHMATVQTGFQRLCLVVFRQGFWGLACWCYILWNRQIWLAILVRPGRKHQALFGHRQQKQFNWSSYKLQRHWHW